ncbi:hypothetical protein FOA52_015114 [Chlamydomonas sp. UWO 241]|nr:hypothetical protein FOA52_015114 [Chlamydomonas sp. UWO 241]
MEAMKEATAQTDVLSPDAPCSTGAAVDVGPSSSLSAEGSRLHATIEGRYVTVLRHKGVLHAIDSICYHAGGPLGVGDIEEVNGRPCILCPWHYYQIDLCTGDKYYQPLKFVDGKMQKGEWASNGVKQRVHSTLEDGGRVLLTLSSPAPGSGVPGSGDGGGESSSGAKIESDKYAFNVPCGERMKGKDSRTTRGQQGVGGDGKLPSGRVFQMGRGGGGGDGGTGGPNGLCPPR